MLDTKLITTLEWIVSNWFPNIPDLDKGLFLEAWISQVETWVSENGVEHTIKRIKFLRLSVTRYLCREPLWVNDLMIGINKDGFPSSIEYMQEFIDPRDPEQIRFIFTLLGISRAMSGDGKVDYSSITDPFKGQYKTFEPFFLEMFVRDFASLPMEDEPFSIRDFFLNLKSGPLSGPALLKAHLAPRFFTGRNLWGLSILLGSDGMRWFKDLFLGTRVNRVPQGNRKLHIIHDPELKERVIAIFDYISQLAFEPISRHMFRLLRNIPQDRTFTQDPVIRDKGSEDSYHSLDLSAATDRFPIDLQVDLLNAIERASPRPFRGIGNAWRSLMVSEPFLTPCGRLLHYAVGQPMGARSSWATFTLSHHCVVQKAAFDCSKYPFKDYILLGDDIVIYDDEVASRYIAIIAELGVDCSPTKSHVSKDTYEFAKRWFHCGIEVSGVPLKGFLANTGNPVLIFQDLLDLVYKGRGPKSIISTVELGVSFLKALGYTKSQRRYYTSMFQDIRFSYRASRDFPDYQLIREFLATASRANDYIMPTSEATLLDEFNRTSSMVVSGMVMTITHRLGKYYTSFKAMFDDCIASPIVISVKPDMFKQHPLVFALYESVRKNSQANKDLESTMDLSRQLMTVTILDLEKLQYQARTSVDIMFTYRTFARKLRLQLEFDPYLIIAKAQTMRFGRALLDIKFAFEKDNPMIKTGNVIAPLEHSSLERLQCQEGPDV